MNVLHRISTSVLVAGLLVFSPIHTPGVGQGDVFGVATADAQNISARSGSRSGAYLSRVRRTGVSPAYSFKRSNLGSGINRAGIYRNVKPRRHHHRYHQRNRNITNSGDQLFIERRRQIERRNARVARENQLRRLNSQRAKQPVYVDPYYYNNNGSGFVDIIGGDGAGVAILRGQPCPTRHNCGYRLYSDGTGPRIITPGQKAGGDLPEFDGLNGPQVITLD